MLLLAVSGQIQVWSEPEAWNPNAGVHAALIAAITLPLLVRRRHPLIVVVVAFSASWLQFELGGALFQPWFADLMALYSVAAHASRNQALVGAAVGAASVLAIDIPRLVAGEPVGEVIPAWFFFAGTWGFGRWMCRRRRETEELIERADTLERERERQAEIAVADERARIARELHDLVAHSMGVVVIQAQGSQRMLDRDTAAVRASLQSIEATGRQGMAELRRLVGMLTDADGPDGRSPQPSLDRLDELVEGVRSAGLDTELQCEGLVRPLSAGVELAAYRIVQEALTNALKHAHARSARVRLHYLPTRIEVEVADDGNGGAPSGSGHGLVGMRERVSIYGGTLTVGDAPEGGFLVRASLPVDGER